MTRRLIRATEYAARTRAAANAKAAASPYDQTTWEILYGALTDSFGLSPENFQLIYPNIVWDWETQATGYIGAAEYDALSTIPQWSAIGNYTSSGEQFNNQYEAFLNVIDPATSDATLRGKIDRANNDLIAAINNYDTVLRQARDAYDGEVSDGDPCFTDWLGTLSGKTWATKLESYGKEVDSAQAVYNSLVDQTTTPNLTEALNAYKDSQWYSKLNDPKLSKFPAVPGYSTDTNAAKWRDRVERGEAPGGSISVSNSSAAFDTTKTWAKGSVSVGSWFWSVNVSGSWERIDSFESDANLSASIEFKGVETIGIQPSGWYKGVTNLAKGPYKRGYSEDGAGGTTAAFGEDGFLPMLKTGMLVASGMTFSISVDQSTFSSFSQKFQAAGGLRIGPFSFGAEGGSSKAGWQADSNSNTFTGTSTSTIPQIFGWTVKVLP